MTIEFWRAFIRKLEGRNISSSYLRRTARQCGIQNYRVVTLSEAKRAKAQAHRAYKCQLKTVDRPSFLDDLADAIAAEGDLERSTVIRQLKSHEETRHTHRQIRNSTKDFDGAPYHMELKNETGTYISTDKVEIEQALMQEYEAKYHLAESSPFLKAPLLHDFGQLGLTPNTDRVLNGIYECPQGTNKYTKCFIKHLARDPIMINKPDNDTVITTVQLNTFWKNMNEKIVSSPSGRHIGTYKATISHDTHASIQTRLTSLPFELGIPLHRTSQCINVSLLKKGKGITPSDLRTIWLLEADFNSGAKIHWVSRMMNDTAMNNNLIPQSQYAKRGSKAIEAALVKVLFFDHIRQNKKPGIIFASDLMQCFDRMAHPVCSLVSRRLGVPESVIKCMLLTIQQMNHRVRTGYGDSNFTYGNNKQRPLQGGGQGNGASLPLWLAISCILIAVLEDRVIGVRMQTAISLQILIYIAIMYVDDTDILLSDITGHDALEDVFQRALRAARTWEEAVLVSGGAVRPEKCYWTAVDFRWKNGNWYYMSMNEFKGEIWVKDTTGVPKRVERYDVNNSKDGLGIHINPDGTMGKQVEYVGNKITKWITKLKPSPLSKHHTYIAANTAIFRTIIYALPASCLSIVECRKLEAILYTDLMPKMGLSSKLPLPYRYGTLAYQGMGLLHIHSQMMIEQLKVFLEHVTKDTQLGISYRATMETLQLEIGSIHDVFVLPYHKYHFLATDSWIKCLWLCLDKYKISLRKPSTPYPPQRTNDFSLMDTVIDAKIFTNSEIYRINLCRIYLQVFYLSDICSGNGRGVMNNYMDGLFSPIRKSTWIWPRQQQPTSKDWKLWRIAIHEVWAHSESHILQNPMGNWTRIPHQTFRFYYDNKIISVIEKKENGSFDVYKKTEGRTRNCAIFTYQYSIFRQKHRWIPISAEHIDYNSIIAEPMMEHIAITTPILPTTLQQYIEYNFPHLMSLFQHSKFHDSGKLIAHAISSNKAIAVTDASVSQFSQSATVSWTITDRKLNVCGDGLAICPPLYHNCDSYGSELFGIYCILAMTFMVTGYYNIQTGSIIIARDNDASLDAGTLPQTNQKADQNYFDLIWEISSLLQKLPITIQKQNVKGHAEDFKPVLNRYEKLNILMDRKAKHFRKQFEDGTVTHHVSYLGARFYSIWIDNKRISSKLEYNIKDHIHGTAMRRKLVEKGDVLVEGIDMIDWEAIGMAGKHLTAYEKLWVTKFTSGFCGTATQMHYRYVSKKKKKEKEALDELDENEENNTEQQKDIVIDQEVSQWTHNLCPLCSTVRENTKHVLICPQKEATFYRSQQFTIFSDWLISQKSDPHFRECVIMVLRSKTNMSFAAAMRTITTSRLHLTAAQEQDIIGLPNFLLGRLSRKWREVQRSYFSHQFPNKKFSADAWTRRVIAKIYKTSQSFWKFRCEYIHGVENVLTSNREKKALQKEIKKQFKLGSEGIRAEHKDLLRGDVNSILQSSIREQKYWVRTLKLSRAYVTESENNMFVGMRSIMLNWAKPPD